MTSQAISVLRRRWGVLLVCVILGALGGIFMTRNTVRLYSAGDTVIVNIPQASNPGEALQGVQLSAQLLASYAQVATSRTAAERIRDQLRLPDSVDAVKSKISAVPVPNTLLIKISATDPDPVRAASLADSAAAVFIDAVARLESSKTDRVQPEVIDPAHVPTRPVQPRPRVNLMLGLLAGTLVGATAMALLEKMDNTVRGPAQLTEALQVPILGVIPRLPGDARPPAQAMQNRLTPGSEAFRALRTSLRFLDLDEPLKTLLVTSPGPEDGKSTVACHLAVALAESGQRVVIVDADLRRGRLFDLLGVPGGAGITSVIIHSAGLDDVLYHWRDDLLALGTGPIPPNPSEILGSQAMASLLDDVANVADVVIIDGAPVLPVTDSVALSTQVDGVVIVGRDRKTDRHGLVEAGRRLQAVGANVVGCVLNAAHPSAVLHDEYQYLEPDETLRPRRLAFLSRVR